MHKKIVERRLLTIVNQILKVFFAEAFKYIAFNLRKIIGYQ